MNNIKNNENIKRAVTPTKLASNKKVIQIKDEKSNTQTMNKIIINNKKTNNKDLNKSAIVYNTQENNIQEKRNSFIIDKNNIKKFNPIQKKNSIGLASSIKEKSFQNTSIIEDKGLLSINTNLNHSNFAPGTTKNKTLNKIRCDSNDLIDISPRLSTEANILKDTLLDKIDYNCIIFEEAETKKEEKIINSKNKLINKI